MICIRPLLLCAFLFFVFTAIAQPPTPAWVSKVGAKPFTFKPNLFKVNDYGAVNDGKKLNTKAIQNAIDACAEKGGGTVVFAPGKYLTGSLFVKTGVNLKIDKGVEILGSQNIKDYPEIDTRVAGIEMKWPAALINILKQEKASISGTGLINAQGKPFWDMYWKMRKEDYDPKGLRWIVDYDAKSPRTILVESSTNVVVKELNIQQAGFWTVQVLYSTYVTVNQLTIRNNVDGHGPSTDGIDIDSSSWILVENCDIDCNDDNFCLKAGRDWDGLRVNWPTEYVVIRNSTAGKGAGLLTLGSETSGSIRHVWATNLVGRGTGNAINIKSARTRGGTVEDVYFGNITINDGGNVIQINPNWNPTYSYSTLPAGYDANKIPPHWTKLLARVEPESKGIPTFRQVYIYNVKATGMKKAINAMGTEKTILKDFKISNLQIEAATAGTIDFGLNWSFDNVSIKAQDQQPLKVTNSTNVKY